MGISRLYFNIKCGLYIIFLHLYEINVNMSIKFMKITRLFIKAERQITKDRFDDVPRGVGYCFAS